MQPLLVKTKYSLEQQPPLVGQPRVFLECNYPWLDLSI